MTKQTTDTGRTLIPEAHYEAMIESVTLKEVREYIIYEWSFSTLVNEKPFYFKIGLFSSQMGELLRALGAKEIQPNKYEWDDGGVVGLTVGFNLVHVEDKKGVIREQLSDIVLLTKIAKDPSDIQWGN